jgi:hypothetical protein
MLLANIQVPNSGVTYRPSGEARDHAHSACAVSGAKPGHR